MVYRDCGDMHVAAECVDKKIQGQKARICTFSCTEDGCNKYWPLTEEEWKEAQKPPHPIHKLKWLLVPVLIIAVLLMCWAVLRRFKCLQRKRQLPPMNVKVDYKNVNMLNSTIETYTHTELDSQWTKT